LQLLDAITYITATDNDVSELQIFSKKVSLMQEQSNSSSPFFIANCIINCHYYYVTAFCLFITLIPKFL